jgi:hypothetical protein
MCKECSRQLCEINERLFNNVYDDKSLCVICRKKKGKILTESERDGIWAESMYICNFKKLEN